MNERINEVNSDFFLRGINDVSEERLRQITEEGYGAISDDTLGNGVLGAAGACYAIHAAWTLEEGSPGKSLSGVPIWWPFGPETWKPEDPRRNLVKAAALLIAQIDKYDRKEVKENETNLGPD